MIIENEEKAARDLADNLKPPISFKLKSAMGGMSNMLMYYGNEERIAFMSDF